MGKLPSWCETLPVQTGPFDHPRVSKTTETATCSARSPKDAPAAWFSEGVAGPIKSCAAAFAAGDGTSDTAALHPPLQFFLSTTSREVHVFFFFFFFFTILALGKPLLCSILPQPVAIFFYSNCMLASCSLMLSNLYVGQHQ